ncbi:uncharacterized protein RBU33_005505 isoform 1-T1 [Hipposideros larvatus]
MTDRQEKHHSYSLCSNASQLLTVQSDLEEVPGKKRKTPKYPLDLAVRLHVVASHGLSALTISLAEDDKPPGNGGATNGRNLGLCISEWNRATCRDGTPTSYH